MDKMRTALDFILSIFIITVALIFLIAGGRAYFYYDSLETKQVSAQTSPVAQISDAASSDFKTEIGSGNNLLYVLFLGIDKNDEREQMGVFRTDTITIARFDLDNKKVKILCVPRDTYTYVPIEGKVDKINHAYAYGSLQNMGPQESINAVHSLLGTPVINKFFVMDMEPIPEIVDEIGGVGIVVDMAMYDSQVNIPEGPRVLNGDQVNLYLRWRNSPGGDIDRIKHQQAFLLALYKQEKASNRLLELIQLVFKYHHNVQSDLSLQQMMGLARFMSEVPGENVEYSIIPGRPQMIDGISYWVMDKEATKTIINDFLES